MDKDSLQRHAVRLKDTTETASALFKEPGPIMVCPSRFSVTGARINV